MNRNLMIGLGALAGVLLLLVLSALFTVHQTQRRSCSSLANPNGW
jgi:hypothetical protein